MKLYYIPGACSLAARIVLHELDLPFSAIRVDAATGRTEHGMDYSAINPKGYVPALQPDDTTVITENPAVLQYLAGLAPEAQLLPPPDSLDRVRAQEWLSFVSSELHKSFGPWFSGRSMQGDELERAEQRLARRIGDVERTLQDGRPFLLGQRFSIADAYLWVVLHWSAFIGLSLQPWPHTAAYVGRLAQRPTIRAALAQENATGIPA